MRPHGTAGHECDASCMENAYRPSKKHVDLSKAHNYVIASNHNDDPTYAPYCGRCSGLYRMTVVEPFLWSHFCGAVHDERQVLT